MRHRNMLRRFFGLEDPFGCARCCKCGCRKHLFVLRSLRKVLGAAKDRRKNRLACFRIAMAGSLSYPLCVTQMKDIQKAALDEACVLAQNRAFYAALRERNVDLMKQVWSQCPNVSCIHPGWQPLRGQETVMASWETILHQSNLPAIYPEDASVQLCGDTALVVCEESFREGRLVATNIFVREADDWRLLHHQAGPLNDDDDLDDELFDDGDPDALLTIEEPESAAHAEEASVLYSDKSDSTDAHSSGDDLVALYLPRRGSRRFIN